MKKILNKLTNHFEDNRTLACITAGLFALGILVFIINNTVLFFVDVKAYFWPRLCMKGATDICWPLLRLHISAYGRGSYSS